MASGFSLPFSLLQIFRFFVHFGFLSLHLASFSTATNSRFFYVKSQYSLLNFFNWHFLHANERLLKQLNYVNYGARVRGSVFRTLFFILAKEFQSIEISAEFACLLEVIYLANESSFFPAKWEYLEMTFAISRKNLQVSMNYLIRLKVNKKLKTYSSPPWMGLKSWFIPRLWPTSWAITPPPNAWTP